MSLKKIAILTELVAILLVGAGIGVEVVVRAPVGYIIISVGACLAMIGGFLWSKVFRRP